MQNIPFQNSNMFPFVKDGGDGVVVRACFATRGSVWTSLNLNAATLREKKRYPWECKMFYSPSITTIYNLITGRKLMSLNNMVAQNGRTKTKRNKIKDFWYKIIDIL